jgi:hypothetical protein
MCELVIIKKRDPIASRLIHAAISRGYNARDRLDHFPNNYGVAFAKTLHYLGCIVRGIVVDNDDFIGKQILRMLHDQALERLAER